MAVDPKDFAAAVNISESAIDPDAFSAAVDLPTEVLGNQFEDVTTPEGLAAKQRAQDMSWPEVLARSAFREARELSRRARRQTYEALDPVSGAEQFERDLIAEREAFAPIAQERPALTFGGAIAPYIYPGARLYDIAAAGGRAIGAAKPTLEGLATSPKVLGATTGAIEGAGTGFLKDENMLLGALTGAMGGYLGGRFADWATRTPDMLTDRMRETVDLADEWGIILGPGARTNISRLQATDASFAADLKTMNTAEAIRNYNNRKMTEKVLGQAGIDADNLTSERLIKAYDDASEGFENIVKTHGSQLDNQMIDDIDEALAGYQEMQLGEESPVVQRYYEQLMEMVQPNGDIPGDRYQQFMSGITQAMDVRFPPSDPKSRAEWMTLKRLRNATQDNVERHLPLDVLDESKDLRRNYAALQIIQEGNVLNRQTGEIDFNALDAELSKPHNRKAYSTLRGPLEDMYKAARIGSYIDNQPGATLQSRQQFSKAVGQNVTDDMSLGDYLRGRGQSLTIPQNVQSFLYRAGYPDVTGGLLLPSGAAGPLVGGGIGIGEDVRAGILGEPGRGINRVYNFLTGEYE